MDFISKNLTRLALLIALVGLFAVGAHVVRAQEAVSATPEDETLDINISIDAELAEELRNAFDEADLEEFSEQQAAYLADELAEPAMKGIIAMAIFMIILGIAAFVFWIVMLIHVLTKPVPSKVVWVLLMVFLGAIGSLIYLIVYHVNYKKQIAEKGFATEPTDADVQQQSDQTTTQN